MHAAKQPGSSRPGFRGSSSGGSHRNLTERSIKDGDEPWAGAALRHGLLDVVPSINHPDESVPGREILPTRDPKDPNPMSMQQDQFSGLRSNSLVAGYYCETAIRNRRYPLGVESSYGRFRD